MTALTITDPRVRAALDVVPRAEFLTEELQHLSFDDRPLDIGQGQTTSQPSLIAWMIQALGLKRGARVLEVGTGCGYQTALLAELGADVYSVEILAPLADQARKTLERLGYGQRIHLRVGDGYQGWPEAAPFDGIVVSAGACRVPRPLLDQLAPGGRLIIPVGDDEDMQLRLYQRDASGDLSLETTLLVRFVPLTGAQADADRGPLKAG